MNHDVLPRVRQFIRRAWAFVRQALSIRGLLQWTGWWETVTATGLSVSLAVGSLLKGLPWPVTITIAAVAFAAVSIIWRVFVQPQRIAQKPTRAEWDEMGRRFRFLDDIDVMYLVSDRSGEVAWTLNPSGGPGSTRRTQEFEAVARRAGALARRAGVVPTTFAPQTSTDSVHYWLSLVVSRIDHSSGLILAGGHGRQFPDVVHASRILCAQLAAETDESVPTPASGPRH